MVPPHPDVAAFMARNHGLITREHALSCGLTREEIDGLLSRGHWQRVRIGVYAENELVASLTLPTQRQLLVDRAACLRISRPFVRSHDTAALELGLGLLLPPRPMTHVTRPCVGTHSRFGVKHHLAPYDESMVTEANGFPVLGRARTAVDIAREHGHPYGVVAIDRARWEGTPLPAFEQVLAGMPNWPHRRRVIRAIELSDAGAETVLETLGRLAVREMGLGIGELETQFGLSDGVRTAFADLRIGRHLFEFDGIQKYVKQDPSRPRSIESVIVEEKRREDWFRGFRLGMSRIAWEEVWCADPRELGRRRRVLERRLVREFAATSAAYGTSIDDLAPFRVPRRRVA